MHVVDVKAGLCVVRIALEEKGETPDNLAKV